MQQQANPDRSVIPNAAVEAGDAPIDADAPLAPPDIEERREAMKTFDAKPPAVAIPIPNPDALASDPEARRDAALDAVRASTGAVKDDPSDAETLDDISRDED